jgi:GDP-L-fucose synthase
MNKDSKIYIAGHLGMVGSAIYRCLLNKGYKNFVFRSIDELDLMRQADVESFFEQERPDYVVDAAAKVGGIIANNIYRAQFIYENLMIQNNLIHASHQVHVKKLLFLGSSCIYPKNAPQPLKEEYLLTGDLEQTNEPYAIAKIAGIKMCESYFRQYGDNFISVMPTNLYGLFDNYNLGTSHVLPALIRKMHLGKCLEINDWNALRLDLDQRPIEGVNGKASETEILAILSKYGITFEGNKVAITLWGSGMIFREFMHAEDMAAACVRVMETLEAVELYAENPDGRRAGFINIGTGTDLSILELSALVKRIVGYKSEIIWDKSKPDGTLKKLLDISKLKNLGFEPAFSIESGIRDVYRNYITKQD